MQMSLLTLVVTSMSYYSQHSRDSDVFVITIELPSLVIIHVI